MKVLTAQSHWVLLEKDGDLYVFYPHKTVDKLVRVIVGEEKQPTVLGWPMPVMFTEGDHVPKGPHEF